MSLYLAIGIGFYVGVSLCRQKSFHGADAISIARGIFLVVLGWPLAMIAVYYQVKEQK